MNANSNSSSPPEAPSRVTPTTTSSGQSTKPLLVDRPWFVIAIVFGAALFLGYPILWRTRAFRRPMKVFLSVLVIVETVVLVWLFCLAMMWSYRRIVDAL